MNKQVVPSLVAVLLLVGGIWFLASGSRPMPEITFNLVDGRTLHSSELQGKSVLVNFWSVSCEVCLRDIPTLNRLQEELSDHDLVVIGVAMPHDPPPAVIGTMEQLKPSYAVALDVQGEINRAFGGIQVTPTNLLIGPDGNINYLERGPLDEIRVRATILTFQR
jgi:thiol-disulfide isomerase/thioredoxin